jgi:hypothetical protein
MVVLPAASRPTMRIRISFLAKRRLNSFVNVSPISEPALEGTKRNRKLQPHRSAQPLPMIKQHQNRAAATRSSDPVLRARRSAAPVHVSRAAGSDSRAAGQGNLARFGRIRVRTKLRNQAVPVSQAQIPRTNSPQSNQIN